MSKAPPIPKEQRSFHGARPDISDAHHDRRDERTGLQSGQPGDADADLKEQGRFGNLDQNVSTVHARTQQR
ncbi:MAG TPA: hypothetical protein PLF78_09300 [Caulobacter sp.]|nr:hypothetical protein [Caulobacter sp.]